ncbi:hypothetical protein DFH07DRAFT_771756 [Mycena maculata]|uniref:Uncharacterized protein n=1 Tax=Mycena maculata TaxID=230809 RepID=A0AAD7JAG3_9AGAR|nr:hypothetical protein DFH07DRAFT_771756 [Mycena maculata]
MWMTGSSGTESENGPMSRAQINLDLEMDEMNGRIIGAGFADDGRRGGKNGSKVEKAIENNKLEAPRDRKQHRDRSSARFNATPPMHNTQDGLGSRCDLETGNRNDLKKSQVRAVDKHIGRMTGPCLIFMVPRSSTLDDNMPAHPRLKQDRVFLVVVFSGFEEERCTTATNEGQIFQSGSEMQVRTTTGSSRTYATEYLGGFNTEFGRDIAFRAVDITGIPPVGVARGSGPVPGLPIFDAVHGDSESKSVKPHEIKINTPTPVGLRPARRDGTAVENDGCRRGRDGSTRPVGMDLQRPRRTGRVRTTGNGRRDGCQ